MSGNSLISQILTEAEITELGLHGSVIKHCSSPYIINKKHFIQICVYYLLSTFLFFFVYVTLTILVLTSFRTELNKTIILVIYIYIFVFFYIDLIVSNTIKYELVRRYNIKEVRKRIYGRFLGPPPGGSRAPSSSAQTSDTLTSSAPISNEPGKCDAPRESPRKKAKAPPRADKANKAKEKEKKKLFISQKYYLVEEEQEQQWERKREANHCEEGRRRARGKRIPSPPPDEEKFYHLDQLKDVNDSINVELMKYIQYENNNYTIESDRYDIFLIISGFVNQLNIFFDLLFLFYVYDYSRKLFSVCLFIYAYYLVHFGMLIRFSIVMIRALFSIHRRSLSRSYRKGASRLLRGMISMRGSNQVVNPRKPKIFFNKYVTYNSWSFAYNQGVSSNGSKDMLKMLRESDSEDIKRVMVHTGRVPTKCIDIHTVPLSRVREKKKKSKQTDRHFQTNTKMRHPKEDCEKALRPSYVQIIADMSSFLSHYRILNIMKSKFLSAHSIYEHMSFTLVFFVWKLLYLDVVLCLLKIFLLFYTSDIFAVGFFLAIALANIANSYVIHLMDNNLMSDMGTS
ncbi:hypothetical protein C922_03518 [Plasmodium inui San Antonio 1]|uniref:Uncharacterized protein n=1 Tax=Plasmodium inui San Antonio 1 TaxID=1237626 RepID=W7A434_9APIC|nr:hypothetical protein C922_03518 [Plasmodium inui San Antonio 1]EUD66048.1 hypothetical protein C922_03518 [Plasmodium inui San Antonio 1]